VIPLTDCRSAEQYTITAVLAETYGIVLVVGWAVWAAPFFRLKQVSGRAEKLDRRARWGILLEALAFALVWQRRFWRESPGAWRIGLSMVFLLLACILSWTAVRALGRQWRIDAGLNADHELVCSGPYRVVRHPIYTSLLCILLGTGLMVAPLLRLALVLPLFIAGTEIRVRIEDRLLASRFGEDFRLYQRSVPAYIPFLNYAWRTS